MLFASIFSLVIFSQLYLPCVLSILSHIRLGLRFRLHWKISEIRYSWCG